MHPPGEKVNRVYEYIVWKYEVGHSELLIKAHEVDKSEDKDVFQLIFQGVLYFEGLLKWQEGEFCVATESESIALLQQIGYEDAIDAVVSSYYHLFKLKHPQFIIRIIAMKMIQVNGFQ